VRVLLLLAGSCAIALLAAAFAWMRHNPMPAYFDEAVYAESAIFDEWQASHRGIRGLTESLVKLDPRRPPLHRVLVLPVSIPAGADLLALRLVSFSLFLLAALMMADAVRRATDGPSAVTAFLLLLGAPILISSTRVFGTEYAMLFAAALLVWSVMRRSPLGVAIAIGLGLLTKATFLLAAIPLLVAAFVLNAMPRRALALACAAGVVVALPWWLHDPMPALRFAFSPAAFVRHRLSVPHYWYEVARTGTGFGIAALLLLIRPRRNALLIMLAAGASLAPILTTFTGSHNPRHLALTIFLAMPALAMALRPRFALVAAVIAALQIGGMAFPRRWSEADAERSFIRRGVLEVFAPVEQWDWSPLREFADNLGKPRPVIATLGEGYQFNRPQIRYAWQRVRRDAQVLSLYRWDADPPLDLRGAIERATVADLVVTAPRYRGEATDGQLPNNVYNDVFTAALARDPRFHGPIALDVGVRQPVRVAVFVRR
jgi:hypothetical protein